MNKMLRYGRIIFFLLCSINLSPINAQSWSDVGTSPICGVDMAVDGNVYVLTSTSTSGIVKKFDGTTWTSLGNPFVSAGTSGLAYVNLSVSSTGSTPYVTYHIMSGPTPVTNSGKSYVSYYNGTSWADLGGGALDGGSERHYPSFDPDNKIAVYTSPTFVSGTGFSNYVSKYSSSWSSVGTVNSSTANPYTSIMPDQLGNSYLAYYSSSLFHVKKINGTTLTDLGTGLNATNFCTSCIRWKIPFCVSPSNVPYVLKVPTETADADYFKIYKYNGTAWDTIQGPEATSALSSSTPPCIEVASNGVIFLGYTYSNGTAKVVYYDGTGWYDLGTQNFTEVYSLKTYDGILFKDGCLKYDASGITMNVTAVENAKYNSEKIVIFSDVNGVVVSSQNTSFATIDILDQLGKPVVHYKGEINGRLTIPLSKQGLYIVKVESELGNKNQKIIFNP